MIGDDRIQIIVRLSRLIQSSWLHIVAQSTCLQRGSHRLVSITASSYMLVSLLIIMMMMTVGLTCLAIKLVREGKEEETFRW